jgi:Spy/CpxP family protein refolding chaperone
MASNAANHSPGSSPGSATLRRTTALVIALFFIGVALGAAGAFLCLRGGWRTMSHYSHPTSAEFVNRLSHDLDLTPQQKSRIQAIVDSAHQRFHDLDNQVEPQYDAIRQDARGQIRLVLTPEQKAKFEEEVRRLDEERRKQMQQ